MVFYCLVHWIRLYSTWFQLLSIILTWVLTNNFIYEYNHFHNNRDTGAVYLKLRLCCLLVSLLYLWRSWHGLDAGATMSASPKWSRPSNKNQVGARNLNHNNALARVLKPPTKYVIQYIDTTDRLAAGTVRLRKKKISEFYWPSKKKYFPWGLCARRQKWVRQALKKSAINHGDYPDRL